MMEEEEEEEERYWCHVINTVFHCVLKTQTLKMSVPHEPRCCFSGFLCTQKECTLVFGIVTVSGPVKTRHLVKKGQKVDNIKERIVSNLGLTQAVRSIYGFAIHTGFVRRTSVHWKPKRCTAIKNGRSQSCGVNKSQRQQRRCEDDLMCLIGFNAGLLSMLHHQVCTNVQPSTDRRSSSRIVKQLTWSTSEDDENNVKKR